jgi:hypothetical protein
VESTRVTPTFRPLVTITAIGALAALAVALLSVPVFTAGFAAAVAFVILDGLIPSSLVRVQRRSRVGSRRLSLRG